MVREEKDEGPYHMQYSLICGFQASFSPAILHPLDMSRYSQYSVVLVRCLQIKWNVLPWMAMLSAQKQFRSCGFRINRTNLIIVVPRYNIIYTQAPQSDALITIKFTPAPPFSFYLTPYRKVSINKETTTTPPHYNDNNIR